MVKKAHMIFSIFSRMQYVNAPCTKAGLKVGFRKCIHLESERDISEVKKAYFAQVHTLTTSLVVAHIIIIQCNHKTIQTFKVYYIWCAKDLYTMYICAEKRTLLQQQSSMALKQVSLSDVWIFANKLHGTGCFINSLSHKKTVNV